MRKAVLLSFLFVLAIQLTSLAQYRWDYGTKVGVSNYLGDIGGKYLPRRDGFVDMHLISSRASTGTYVRYKFNKRFAVSSNIDYIRITDRDAYTTYAPRRARNANFRNDIVEMGTRAEVTIWYDNDVGNKGYYNPDFKLFVFAGVAGYYSNPKGQIYSNGELQYGGKWFDLRNWKTEGQDRIQWDLSWRTVFTDYLDDVSTVFNKPNTDDPLALEFVNQSYQSLINGLLADNPQYTAADLAIENFTYVYNPAAPLSPRGDSQHNDSYLTSQITITKLIRGKSNFYKAKYSYLKNRAGVRKSRAKF
jgi:hypothetical protein